MSALLRSFLVRAVLGAALLLGGPALLAQTHLGVPAKQLVEIQFYPYSADPTGAYSYLGLFRPDGKYVDNWTIPAGQTLVLLDFHVTGVQVPASSGIVNNSVWIVRKYAGVANALNQLAAFPVTVPVHAGNNAAFQANLSLTAGLVFTAAAPPAMLPQISGAASLELRATGYLTAN